MSHLKVTDLFKDSGRNFDYVSRNRDQLLLIKRMSDHESLQKISEDFHIFCDEVGIVSLNYLEYFFKELTKTCSKQNIQMV